MSFFSSKRDPNPPLEKNSYLSHIFYFEVFPKGSHQFFMAPLSLWTTRKAIPAEDDPMVLRWPAGAVLPGGGGARGVDRPTLAPGGQDEGAPPAPPAPPGLSPPQVLHLLHLGGDHLASGLRRLTFSCYKTPIFQFQAVPFSERFLLTNVLHKLPQVGPWTTALL